MNEDGDQVQEVFSTPFHVFFILDVVSVCGTGVAREPDGTLLLANVVLVPF